jgi:hypothetical protein
MTEQERLAKAAEYGRQAAAKIHAHLDQMRDEAARLGFDGVAALNAAFAAAPPIVLTPAAARLFGRASEALPAARPRPRLVWSRD